ncbi:uncharacterized protein LOC119673389 [Teleopsis dalmanni]|uniref:uncharacterized protein LOC119673389 n=1 Tax=Teleopsis dalmanni TaxID=139649 RepID=UPI0018CE49B9|nr:uncharacterized protein LOC119673389 [Teleopsis dalmanni]
MGLKRFTRDPFGLSEIGLFPQVFILTIVILIENVSDHSYTSQAMLVCGTLSGYMIICSALLIGKLMKSINFTKFHYNSIYLLGHLLGTPTPVDKRIDLLFSIGACIMFVSSGAVIVDQWSTAYTSRKDKNTIIAAGAMAIITGAIFIADTLVIFRS